VEITFLFKVHVQGSLQVIGNCSLIFKWVGFSWIDQLYQNFDYYLKS
jgi:hypothetical protein